MVHARQHRFSRTNAGAIGLLMSLALLLSLVLTPLLSLAQADDSVIGQFSVKIVRVDVAPDLPDGYNYVGTWIIDINEDGTYSASRQDVGLLLTGSWTGSGNQITFTDEAGLVSCTNPTAVTIPGDDVSSGTYEWTRTGDDLQLVPVEDGCGGRLLLFSTHTLGPYVPCVVEPLDISEAETASDEIVPLASPEASVDEVLTPDDAAASTRGGSTSTDATAEATSEPLGDVDAITQDIDDLLGQMTSCWSTGDPELWLALLSNDFRDALIGNDDNFLTTIQSAMAVPIIWERAGAVELDSASSASAIVRTTVDTEQDFQRFMFVLEDGQWRWDG